jgi:uncharacterized protein DUF6879
MELISAEQRGALLGSAREILKLELLDHYAADAALFAAWRAGDVGTVAASYAQWRDVVAAEIEAGVTARRVRVVSEPLSEYQRMAVEWSGLAVDAGEQLRWLPRRLVSTEPLPGNDFFVLDGQIAMFNVHDGHDNLVENQLSRDPGVVKFCQGAFERAWGMAIPHREYKPS